MKSITIERAVMVDQKYTDVSEVIDELNRDGDTRHHFSYVKDDMIDSMREIGSAIIGTASITITLLPDEDITTGQIEALRAMREKILAEARAKASIIEDQISKLTAIGYN
jgi:hypothetical protein